MISRLLRDYLFAFFRRLFVDKQDGLVQIIKTTVVPTKSDSGVKFYLQFFRETLTFTLHLNGVSLAGRWWPVYCGIWVFGPPPLIN